MAEPPRYCKYCGAELLMDSVGLFCPTRNCQWGPGVPTCEEQVDAPRTAEEWADYCYREWHRSPSPSPLLCLSCARAYARQETP